MPVALIFPALTGCAQQRPRPDAIIALGAILQGQTPQYALLAQTVMHGLMTVSLQTGIPVSCGVIVAERLAQAQARSDGTLANRGSEAAEAALAVLPWRRSSRATTRSRASRR